MLLDKEIKLRLPSELIEKMKSQEHQYTTKIRDILLEHYDMTLLQIKLERLNNSILVEETK
jgi:hypothetical protein